MPGVCRSKLKEKADRVHRGNNKKPPAGLNQVREAVRIVIPISEIDYAAFSSATVFVAASPFNVEMNCFMAGESTLLFL